MWSAFNMKTLQVELGERSYPIHIGRGLLCSDWFEQVGIKPGRKIMIITDTNVAPRYLEGWKRTLSEAGYTVFEAIVPAGEKSKSLQVFEQLSAQALNYGLDRQSVIVALGGGVVGDVAGFVAASYMRGIAFVQIPTTLLAHDSSVGGKVAVNLPSAKNIIGAFHQPLMVLYDVDTLNTLPPRELSNGIAEIIKLGLIWDAEFVDWLDAHLDQILKLDPDKLEEAIYKACAIKAHIVSKDERENDLRAILNLGHTIGHAIEAIAEYENILHGEAVSIGMVGAASLGERLGGSTDMVKRTIQLLKKVNLPTTLPSTYSIDSIIQAMMHDKKFKEGTAVMVIPVRIGAVEIRQGIPRDRIKEVLLELQQGEMGI
jgi:3-dehydroquinate synthase